MERSLVIAPGATADAVAAEGGTRDTPQPKLEYSTDRLLMMSPGGHAGDNANNGSKNTRNLWLFCMRQVDSATVPFSNACIYSRRERGRRCRTGRPEYLRRWH